MNIMDVMNVLLAVDCGVRNPAKAYSISLPAQRSLGEGSSTEEMRLDAYLWRG